MATQVHLVSDDSIISRIHIIRDIKVMIDKDLAILYNIETRVLKQAVRRNIESDSGVKSIINRTQVNYLLACKPF